MIEYELLELCVITIGLFVYCIFPNENGVKANVTLFLAAFSNI